MNCAMPCAPLGLTAPGLKRLSFQMSRTKNIAGNPLRIRLLLHQRADRIDEGLRLVCGNFRCCRNAVFDVVAMRRKRP